MFERRGTIFLQDEHDWIIFDCYELSLENNGFSKTINAMVVDKYCEKYELDFIEMLSICKQI